MSVLCQKKKKSYTKNLLRNPNKPRALKGVMHITQSTLLFIGNELLDPRTRDTLGLPLQFISYGFIEGKLYRHYRNDGTFILQDSGKEWGNSVVYGAIFALPDFDFYIRLLDSYHQCSQSALARNHSRDVHHRHITQATPIAFSTFEDFTHLKYRERSPFDVHVYLGNKTHPKITQRLTKTHSYRLVSGVDERILLDYFGRNKE